MKTNAIRAAFAAVGTSRSEECMEWFAEQVSQGKTYLLLKTGAIIEDTRCNRAMNYMGGYVLSKSGMSKIPFTQYFGARPKNIKQVEPVVTSFKVVECVVVEKLESERRMFRECQGVRTRKHGQRGGIGFSEMRKIVECKTETVTRPWKRGERVKMRNENKRNREVEAREKRALAVIRFAKVGLIYKSEPKATKANCGRVIY